MPPIAESDGATTIDNNFTGDDGVDAFLKTFLPPDAQKKEPSEGTAEAKDETKPSTETEDDTTSDESPEGEKSEEETEEGTEDAEATEAERKYADDADTYVKIKVGDKEHEVAVKDLKRLYGQEASLTQKSQKVSDETKRVETELAKNVAASNALLERAKARFEPYSKIDFVLAAQKLSAEEYTALRSEALKAHEDVQFLEQHLGGFMQTIQTQQQASLRERAQATLKELGGEDPALSIPGWDESAYKDLSVYATTHFGVPADVMNNLVDAWGLRVLHKAMLYDKGQKSGQVKVTKVNKTPKKVVKTTTTPAASKSNNASGKEKAMDTLRREGTTDAAEAAFLARWNEDA